MKIIIDTTLGTDNVTSIAATSADTAFPVTNLQDNFTTNLWKAANGVTTATITLTVSKGSAVELFNTNATSATVTAGTGGAYEFEVGYSAETGYSLEDSATGVVTTYNLPGTKGRLWADYPIFATPHLVKITLTAASTVYGGIVRAGNVEAFADPSFGLLEGSNDYSIEAELNNGADYFRVRNIVRTFSELSLFETKANAFKFKHDIFDLIGPTPLAIRLSCKATDQEFVLFSKRIKDSIQIKPISKTHWSINFALKEVI